MIKKILLATILAGLLLTAGCFSGPGFTPSDSECMYRCDKCGRKVLMLNSMLKGEACPSDGRHEWRFNLHNN